METCVAVYASLNQVTRIKRRLYRDGVYVDMMRTPHCLTAGGCSFALRCDADLLPLIRRISEELSIEIQGTFVEIEDGASRRYVRSAREPEAE